MNPVCRSLLDMTICLLLTVSAEGIVIFLVSRRLKYVWYSVICNLLTNPVLNLVMLLCAPFFADSHIFAYALLALLELLAIAVEGIIYRTLTDMSTARAMMLSLLLNTVSFLSGVILLW